MSKKIAYTAFVTALFTAIKYMVRTP